MYRVRSFRRRALLLGVLPAVALSVGSILLSTAPQRAAAGSPTLTIGTVSTHPGNQGNFNVTLATGGAAIAGIQNDITFDPVNAPIAASNGQPNCTLNPSLGRTGNFAFLPPGCSGADCRILRAVITSFSNLTALPSAVMYTCTVQAGTATGTYPLTAFRALGSSGTGSPITVSITDGQVTVLPSGCL